MDNELNNLERALDFLDRCRKDSTANATGAYRDAREWIESAARDVVRARRRVQPSLDGVTPDGHAVDMKPYPAGDENFFGGGA
jgi:hypothetical protein